MHPGKVFFCVLFLRKILNSNGASLNHNGEQNVYQLAGVKTIWNMLSKATNLLSICSYCQLQYFKFFTFHFHHTNVILFGSQEAQERKERRAKRFGLQAKQKDTEKDDSHSEDDPDTV